MDGCCHSDNYGNIHMSYILTAVSVTNNIIGLVPVDQRLSTIGTRNCLSNWLSNVWLISLHACSFG